MPINPDESRVTRDENDKKATMKSDSHSTRINILVENLAGKFYEVCISRFKSVLDLKEKIYKYEDISIDSQNLIYNKSVLSNSSMLFDYGIEEGAVVRLVVNMNCGPFGYWADEVNIDKMVVKMFGEDRKTSPLTILPKILDEKQEKCLHKIESKCHSRRCHLCRRKLGMLGEYSCRCGRNFCTLHRHPESHECPYDYKTAAKRELARRNPLVGGIRLPRI